MGLGVGIIAHMVDCIITSGMSSGEGGWGGVGRGGAGRGEVGRGGAGIIIAYVVYCVSSSVSWRRECR